VEMIVIGERSVLSILLELDKEIQTQKLITIKE
jgi:hypothetical protein